MQGVVVQMVPGNTYKPRLRYESKASKILGSIQMCIGVFCIILNIIGLTMDTRMFSYAHGLWGGCIFVITGAIGLGAGFTRNKCLVVAFLVMSILSDITIFFFLNCGVALLTLLILSMVDADNKSSYYAEIPPSDLKIMIGIAAVLLILGLIEMIVAIKSSVLGCHAVCQCCACCGRCGCCRELDEPEQLLITSAGTHTLQEVSPYTDGDTQNTTPEKQQEGSSLLVAPSVSSHQQGRHLPVL